jgi:hypothetical protein
MTELSTLVSQSMENAGETAETFADAGGETETTADAPVESTAGVADSGDEGDESTVEVAADPAPKEEVAVETKPAVAAEPKDDLDRVLEQYGIKGPRKGQREGTFTYTRFRKVLGQEIKRAADKFEGDIKPLKERTTQIEAVERLIAGDPTRYLTMLSAVHPQYKKFLEPPAPPAPAAPEKPAFDAGADPMPQPDAKFSDGSLGYSPEGFQKYQEWNNRRVEAQVAAKIQRAVDARLTPIERERQAAQARAAEMPRVQATIAKLSEKWGEIFTNDVGDVGKPNPNSQLMRHMRENPGMTVYEAAMDVYLPIQQKNYQDRLDRQREDIHKELNARPAAASRSGGVERPERDSSAPRTLEQIVREQMAGADR